MVDSTTRNRRDDDVDDFMATLLSGQSTPTPVQTQFSSGLENATVSVPRQHSHQAKKISEPKRKQRLRKGFRVLLATALLILLSTGVFLVLRSPVASFLEPKSPFSEELAQKVDFPLYYPTKLPDGFKIELDSIKQPVDDVVVYAMSDDNGKRINITLQQQPSSLNLEPLYEVLTDLEAIDTKYGKVNQGISKEGFALTNVTTGKTWVIINSGKDSIGQTEIRMLINSFKEVSNLKLSDT